MRLIPFIIFVNIVFQLPDILKENQGVFTFTYIQCEYPVRTMDFPIKIQIEGNHIIGIQEKPYVTGGDTIINSSIFLHEGGKFIISDDRNDKNADDIGCCTGILIINFDEKSIEAC